MFGMYIIYIEKIDILLEAIEMCNHIYFSHCCGNPHFFPTGVTPLNKIIFFMCTSSVLDLHISFFHHTISPSTTPQKFPDRKSCPGIVYAAAFNIFSIKIP